MRMSRSGLIAHARNEFVVIRCVAVDWIVRVSSWIWPDANCLFALEWVSGWENSALTKWILCSALLGEFNIWVWRRHWRGGSMEPMVAPMAAQIWLVSSWTLWLWASHLAASRFLTFLSCNSVFPAAWETLIRLHGVSFILDVAVNSVAVGYSLKARSVFSIQSTGEKSSQCVKL